MIIILGYMSNRKKKAPTYIINCQRARGFPGEKRLESKGV